MLESLRLLHDQIAVVPLPPSLKHGSLYLPENQEWLDRTKGQAIQGTVVAVGLGDKLGTAGAMRVNSRPVGYKENLDTQDATELMAKATCPSCQSADSPQYRMDVNTFVCGSCGHSEGRRGKFYPHLPTYGHKIGALVVFEDKMYEWTGYLEWSEVDIQTRRAPMFVSIGDTVLIWPTEQRLRKIGDQQGYLLHEEQHVIGIMRYGPATPLYSSGSLIPLYDRIVVRRSPLPEQIRGIATPATAKNESYEGTVVAVGNGIRRKDGSMQPLETQVGQTVVFERRSGSEIRVDQEEFLVMREDEVLGVLEAVA